MESPKNTLVLKIVLNVEVSILDEDADSFSRVIEQKSILGTELAMSFLLSGFPQADRAMIPINGIVIF
ncbi:hypothetical protein [Bacillus cereus]|uniref:Uncharacterized protein n=1 Tax=Bacillus cereus TaxID=1396 RepID=A0A0G8F5S6_BACCE|nr:hypothetical protein [Bacillus cereus]KLA31042.1 hypothetical protein B4077_3310 [Bacillus cereus]